jgi:hypothetical protein
MRCLVHVYHRSISGLIHVQRSSRNGQKSHLAGALEKPWYIGREHFVHVEDEVLVEPRHVPKILDVPQSLIAILGFVLGFRVRPEDP